MSHDRQADATETDHGLERWAEGDWRMAIGRLRAMGRHDLADELVLPVPLPVRVRLLEEPFLGRSSC